MNKFGHLSKDFVTGRLKKVFKKFMSDTFGNRLTILVLVDHSWQPCLL